MMVQIMEGKWQNVQMTADYKVMRMSYTGSIFSAFPYIFSLNQSKSIPSALMAFFSGARLHSFLDCWQPWSARRQWHGCCSLPSGDWVPGSSIPRNGTHIVKRSNPYPILDAKCSLQFVIIYSVYSLWHRNCHWELSWPTKQHLRYLVDTLESCQALRGKLNCIS